MNEHQKTMSMLSEVKDYMKDAEDSVDLLAKLIVGVLVMQIWLFGFIVWMWLA